MKVLHLAHHFSPCIGGVEQVVLDSCISGKKNGIDCEVLCLNKCSKSSEKLKAEEVVQGIKVWRSPFLDLGIYKIAFCVPKILLKSKPDIVHVHGINFLSDFLIVTKPLHRKKVVVSTHGGVFHTKNFGLLKKIYFNGVQKILLKLADRVIAVSENDRSMFRKIVPEKKIALLENAVDVSKFSSSNSKKEKNLFLYVGRLSRNKGLEKLIEGFAVAAKRKKNARLLIVGKDFENLKEELEKKAGEFGVSKQVEITGGVSDKKLREFYEKAEFFVSASEHEGFGITAIEAMAAEKIVLLNKIPSFEKFVKQGVNGFIVGFENSKKAGRDMIKAMDLPASVKRKIAMEARRRALDFSLKKYGKKLESIYLEVIE